MSEAITKATEDLAESLFSAWQTTACSELDGDHILKWGDLGDHWKKAWITVAAAALSQPAPSPQAPGRRKGPPGITLEPQGHEQPAAPVDELIEALEDLMGWQVKNVALWHNRAYDRAHRAIKKHRAALQSTAPQTKDQP